MKSFTRLFAVLGILLFTAVSCSANATAADKSNTIVDASFEAVALEVADFNVISVSVSSSDNALTKQSKDAVLPAQYFIESPVSEGGILNEITEQAFVKIKRFPNPRDTL